MITEGRMYEDARGTFFEYEEDGVATVIGISRGIVTLTRMKDPSYTLVLEENTPYSCFLSTDLGDIPVTVMPNKVNFRRGKTAMFLTLSYDMRFTAEEALRRSVRIKAELMGNSPPAKLQ